MEILDDNFKDDENGRKFTGRVENSAENGEIARYEQFLLFPKFFFFKPVLQTHNNLHLFGKGFLYQNLMMIKLWAGPIESISRRQTKCDSKF